MKIGVCTSPDQASQARNAGFAYLEVNVQSVLKGNDDEATWSASAPDPDALALPIEAANCLVPGNMKITGPDRDLSALDRYMAHIASRAAKLGIQRLVLGSGGARNVPEGYDREKAFGELAEFARLAAEHAARHDVLIVIEPLRSAETNIINRVREEHRLIERASHPACTALVDAYQFACEDDSFEDLVMLGDRLQHVHVAEKHGRLHPGAHGQSDEAYDFVAFFSVLRKMGYDQRISFEGKWSTSMAEDGPATVHYLREAWAESASATAGA